MVRHHLYRHLRGPCWWMARHTSHVVSTLFSIDGNSILHIHIKVIWSSGGEVFARILLDFSRVLRRSGAYVDPVHPSMYVTYKVCQRVTYVVIGSPGGCTWGLTLYWVNRFSNRPHTSYYPYVNPPLCETHCHFHPFSDSFRIKCHRPSNFICPIVSPSLTNSFDSLLDCERQRFPYRK